MKKVFLLSMMVLFVVGCEVTPHYNRTMVMNLEPSLRKKPYDSVKLFQSKDEVTKKYDVIAKMSVGGNPGEEVGFLKALCYRAADVGADAVIIEKRDFVGNQISINAEAVHFQ